MSFLVRVLLQFSVVVVVPHECLHLQNQPL